MFNLNKFKILHLNQLFFNKQQRISIFEGRKKFLISDLDRVKKLLKISSEYQSFYPAIYTSKPFSDCLLVGVQHMQGTTADVFKAMHALGLKKAIIGEKSYSSHALTIEKYKSISPDYTFVPAPKQWGYGAYDQLISKQTAIEIWRLALKELETNSYKTLIMLDNGCDFLLNIPAQIVNYPNQYPINIFGITHIQSTLIYKLIRGIPFPIINVGNSSIKKELEYPQLASVIAKKIKIAVKYYLSYSYSSPFIIGIIGEGAMLKALFDSLNGAPYQLKVYNYALSNNSHETLIKLFDEADIIVGATGNDITQHEQVLELLAQSKKDKLLISAGFEDKEFLNFLHYAQIQIAYPLSHDFTNDIVFTTEKAKIIVCNGGFPVYFDNKYRNFVTDMWPTNTALLMAALMSVNLSKTTSLGIERKNKILPLEVQAQDIIKKEYEFNNLDNYMLNRIKVFKSHLNFFVNKLQNKDYINNMTINDFKPYSGSEYKK